MKNERNLIIFFFFPLNSVFALATAAIVVVDDNLNNAIPWKNFLT